MNYQDYYAELGKLLYAVAKVDGKIQKMELQKFHRIVEEELALLENSADEFNTDTAFVAEFEFDLLQDQDMKAEDAYRSFSEFVHAHPGLPPKLKRLAYRSALKVADSFHGTNHHEEEILSHLKNLLREPADSYLLSDLSLRTTL